MAGLDYITTIDCMISSWDIFYNTFCWRSTQFDLVCLYIINRIGLSVLSLCCTSFSCIISKPATSFHRIIFRYLKSIRGIHYGFLSRNFVSLIYRIFHYTWINPRLHNKYTPIHVKFAMDSFDKLIYVLLQSKMCVALLTLFGHNFYYLSGAERLTYIMLCHIITVPPVD